MPSKNRFGARKSSRVVAITTVAALAVAGAAFGTAATANAVDAPPTSQTPSLTSLANWKESVDPAVYDYALKTVGSTPVLRYSNWTSNPENGYGAIKQLNTPVVADAGESSTDADNNTFTEEFTVGAETYDAQPGLAIEVDADKDGNRAGGNLLLRQDTAGQLTLANFYATPDGDGDVNWHSVIADVPFTKPVKIKYVTHFVDDGADIVKVYADGVLKLTSSSFEEYTQVADGHREAVNSILFRTGFRKAVEGDSWVDAKPSTGELAALKGKGFDFSGIKLTSSNSVVLPATTNKVIQFSDIGVEGDGYPSNDVFVGAPAHNTDNPGLDGVSGAKLQVKATTQVLHAFPANARPTDLTGFIDSGLGWTQDGSGATGGFFQIPLTYGSGNSFVTLRPAEVTAGANTAQWDQVWTSSHDTFNGTLAQIVSQIEAAGNVHIFGYGVFAQNATALTSFQAGGTKYTFDASPSVTVTPVTISDTTPVVGETLTVSLTPNSTTGVSEPTIHWYADGKRIDGADDDTYVVVPADLGKKLSVHAFVTKPGFTSVTGVSADTSKVAAGIIHGASVAITGTKTVGSTLTAAPDSDETTSKSYQWRRDGAKIAGATAATYKLSADDLNAVVSVTVVFSKKSYASVSVPSPTSTDTVGLGSFDLATPVIKGTIKVGKTITASAAASVPGTTKLYEFAIGDPDNGAFVQVSTKATFKIPAYLKGSPITVRVLAFKTGYAGDSADSAATVAVG